MIPLPPEVRLGELLAVFPLPWSVYVRLLSVKDERAREFYEAEALRSFRGRRHEISIDLELQTSGQCNDARSNRARVLIERVGTSHHLYSRGAIRRIAMHHDEIIEEVWANRERLAVQRNYDVRALYEDAKNRERSSDRKVVKLAPRRWPTVETIEE